MAHLYLVALKFHDSNIHFECETKCGALLSGQPSYIMYLILLGISLKNLKLELSLMDSNSGRDQSEEWVTTSCRPGLQSENTWMKYADVPSEIKRNCAQGQSSDGDFC